MPPYTVKPHALVVRWQQVEDLKPLKRSVAIGLLIKMSLTRTDGLNPGNILDGGKNEKV